MVNVVSARNNLQHAVFSRSDMENCVVTSCWKG